MSLQIKWTKRALNDFIGIEDYISGSFGPNASKRFINRVYSATKLLESFPQLGKNEFGEVYSLVIAKQTTLFYRLTEKEIIILKLFVVKQDSKKRHQF